MPELARWFSLQGCPNCDAVRQFFLANKIEAEEIRIGTSQIISAGIRSFANGQFMAPVIESYLPPMLIYGFQPEQLSKIVEAVNAIRGGARTEPPSAPPAGS